MGDWNREPWVKVFPREQGTWSAISWQARGVYRLLQGEASRDGILRPGHRGTRWVAIVFRMTDDEAARWCEELFEEGYMQVMSDDSWLLPFHAEQQATTMSSSDRVKRFRERQKEPLQNVDVTRNVSDVTDDVSLKPKEREKEIKKDNKERDSARNGSLDPRASQISLALAANKTFASLPALDVAEALLAHLGAAAFGVTESQLTEAIAEAAVQVETGATEARKRQVLSWKFSNLRKPKWRRDNAPRVQGEGQEQELKRLEDKRVKPVSKSDVAF